MLLGGGAFMAIGLGEGANKAQKAIHQALHHPLLEMDSLDQARGVLVHFTGGEDLTLYEIGEAITEMRDTLSPNADVVFGASTENTMVSRAQVILVVTGIGASPVAEQELTQAGQEGQSAKQPQVDELDLPTFLRKRIAIG
jgi:cell division protein FtsZ